MDETEIRRILDKNLKHMKWALQLQQWTLHLRLDHIGNNATARCEPQPEYRHAKLTFDPIEQESPHDLLENLRHELLHCLISRFETYRAAVRALVAKDIFYALDVVYYGAVEETVGDIERMLDYGLGITPAKMVPTTKRVIAKKEEGNG